MENNIELPETTVPTETKVPFVIDDAGKADWLVGIIAAKRDEQARIKANAAERVRELETDIASLMYQFGEQVRVWGKGESERRRRQTVTLLNGALVFRHEGEKFAVVNDEAAFVEARTVCPDAIQTVEKLDKRVYIEYAKDERERTGEIAPGIEIVPPRETFTVTTGKSRAEGAEPEV